MIAWDKIKFVLTDIDDTLTENGLLNPAAFQALYHLQAKGIAVIPVTGRPAGWCELIARQWPVAGVVGENGAFYFSLKNNKMLRYFSIEESDRQKYQTQLQLIKQEILTKVPNCRISSDQFCRMFDLAIDICEDIAPLNDQEIHKILAIFNEHQAIAKKSSIHINAWFGDYDKKSAALVFLKSEFLLTDTQIQEQVVFIGDSPNDEPMWAYFKNSVGVANIRPYLPELTHHPKWITTASGGHGFVEMVTKIISSIE